jgi:hypothetical protein
MDHFLEDIETYNAKRLKEQRDDVAEARAEARKEVSDNS